MKTKTIRDNNLIGKDKVVPFAENWGKAKCHVCGSEADVPGKDIRLSGCPGCYATGGHGAKSTVLQTVMDVLVVSGRIGPHQGEEQAFSSLDSFEARWRSVDGFIKWIATRADPEWSAKLEEGLKQLRAERGVTAEDQQKAYEEYKKSQKAVPSKFMTNRGKLSEKAVEQYERQLAQAYGKGGPRKEQKGWVGGAGQTVHNADSPPKKLKFYQNKD